MYLHVLRGALALLVLFAVSARAADDDPLQPIAYVPEAIGPYHWPITTDTLRAQQYFDQGMQLRYGYSVREAARSMAMARRLDPDCAICFWGEAFALGSFLNSGMSNEDGVLAHAAITRAEALIDNASPLEADLIRAAVVRYPADYDQDARRPVDEAFAAAMADVHARYPEHPEVTVVYATALFLLEDRRGYRDLEDPDLQRIHALLKSVLADDPAHPGACHLYIHATESTSQPELGLPCAEVLGDAVPGASHIQHMPSHAWNEVGLWRRSVEANLKAWRADRAALRNAGFSYGESHNLHMLLFAASFDGQGDVAVQAGDDHAAVTGKPIYALLTRVRFGRFDEILEMDTRPEEPLQRAIHDFARGYALLRSGDVRGAQRLRDAVLAYAEDTDDRLRFHDAGTVMSALGALLEGEIHREAGDLDAAIAAFERAVELEDSLDYDEPEPLPFAPRHWLGAALLEAGRAGEAELVYRIELADHPHNGWSLFGLQQALTAQGRSDGYVDRDLVASWGRADLELEASRL
jgi:tetratricopeptide (TPR) repeat protein